MGSDSVKKSKGSSYSYGYNYFSSNYSSSSKLQTVTIFILLIILSFSFLNTVLVYIPSFSSSTTSTSSVTDTTDTTDTIDTIDTSKTISSSSNIKSNIRSLASKTRTTKTTGISEVEIINTRKSLPPQCQSTFQRLVKCQQNTNTNNPNTNTNPNNNRKETIIFACHRKWCNSIYGHCEKVNGIGDRTKHMLSLFSDALDKCLRIELDYPQKGNGIEIRLNDLIYQEEGILWNALTEILHFRSYGHVEDVYVNVNEWGKDLDGHGHGHDSTNVATTSSTTTGKKTFVPFIPSHDQYTFHKYDPCLYHILFKTTPKLDTQIQYYSHLMKMNTSTSTSTNMSTSTSTTNDSLHDDHNNHNNNNHNNVLGMHFRTGDLTAFGLHNNDIRTSSDTLIESYDKMIICAQIHAKKLGLVPESVSSQSSSSAAAAAKDGNNNNMEEQQNQKIKIFLATDNQIIKDKAKHEKRFDIYMTEDKPTAYVRSEGDRSAYTDLYLLSKTKGLVVNELPNKYVGPAEKVSTFAQLAMSIGFMEDWQLHRCKLD